MPGIRVCDLRGWYSDLVLLGDRIGSRPKRRPLGLIQALRPVSVRVGHEMSADEYGNAAAGTIRGGRSIGDALYGRT